MATKHIIRGIKPNPKINAPCNFQILLSMLEFFDKPILPVLISYIDIYCLKNNTLAFKVYEFRQMKEIYDQSGVKMKKCFIDRDLFFYIQNLIDRDIPIGLVIHKRFMKKFQFESAAERENYHHLLIYGYNNEEQIFYTIDHNHYNSFVYSYDTVSYKEVDAFLKAFLAILNDKKDNYVHFYYLSPSHISPKTGEELRTLYLHDYNAVKSRIVDGMKTFSEFTKSIAQSKEFSENYLINLRKLYDNILLINNRKRLDLLKFLLLFGETSVFYKYQKDIISSYVALSGRIGRVLYYNRITQEEKDRLYYYLKKIEEKENYIYIALHNEFNHRYRRKMNGHN